MLVFWGSDRYLSDIVSDEHKMHKKRRSPGGAGTSGNAQSSQRYTDAYRSSDVFNYSNFRVLFLDLKASVWLVNENGRYEHKKYEFGIHPERGRPAKGAASAAPRGRLSSYGIHLHAGSVAVMPVLAGIFEFACAARKDLCKKDREKLVYYSYRA